MLWGMGWEQGMAMSTSGGGWGERAAAAGGIDELFELLIEPALVPRTECLGAFAPTAVVLQTLTSPGK